MDWCPRPYPACQSPFRNESLVPTWAIHSSHTRDLSCRTGNRGAQTGRPSRPLHTPEGAGAPPGRCRSGLAALTAYAPQAGSPGEVQTWGGCPAPGPQQPSAQHQLANPASHHASPPSPARPGLIQNQGGLIKAAPLLLGGEANWESRPVPGTSPCFPSAWTATPAPSWAPGGRLGVRSPASFRGPSPQPLTPQARPALTGGKRESVGRPPA